MGRNVFGKITRLLYNFAKLIRPLTDITNLITIINYSLIKLWGMWL